MTLSGASGVGMSDAEYVQSMCILLTAIRKPKDVRVSMAEVAKQVITTNVCADGLIPGGGVKKLLEGVALLREEAVTAPEHPEPAPAIGAALADTAEAMVVEAPIVVEKGTEVAALAGAEPAAAAAAAPPTAQPVPTAAAAAEAAAESSQAPSPVVAAAEAAAESSQAPSPAVAAAEAAAESSQAPSPAVAAEEAAAESWEAPSADVAAEKASAKSLEALESALSAAMDADIQADEEADAEADAAALAESLKVPPPAASAVGAATVPLETLLPPAPAAKVPAAPLADLAIPPKITSMPPPTKAPMKPAKPSAKSHKAPATGKVKELIFFAGRETDQIGGSVGEKGGLELCVPGSQQFICVLKQNK